MLGLADADSAEHGVASGNLLITAVACPMPDGGAGGPKLHGGAKVRLRAGTRIQRIYGCDEAEERYFCSYEVNPAYRSSLEAAGLRLCAFSEDDDVRAAELPMHPFFVVTLFQPQLSLQAGSAHPLITAFLRACREQRQVRVKSAMA
ncbi:MAG: hypothetical protein U0Q18_30985 [Bryobacteraceae bacterium]